MAKDNRIKQYQLANGTKRFSFRLYAGIDPMTGKKVKITKKGFKTEHEAYLTLIRLELEIQENGLPKKEVNKKFVDIYEVWLDNYKHTVKESTLANTVSYFNYHILDKFGDRYINKIDVLYCQKTINEWAKKSPNNFKRFKNLTSNIFKYAISIGYVEDNPMGKVTLPRVEKHCSEEKRINFYTKEELQEFLMAAKEDFSHKEYVFFRLLAFSGMRKGEAFALTWNDINFSNKSIKINKTVSRGFKNRVLVNSPKTKNSNRTISVDDGTLELLKKWKKEQKIEYFKLGINTLNAEQYIFSDYNNKLHDPTVTSIWLRQLYRKHDTLKKISAHGFRHTHASILFEADVPLKEVQERLGHADIQTTANIYTHVTAKKKEQTGNKFANYMGF